MELICDLKMMNDAMVEIGFDASKMPLGKLSKRTITQGYEILQQISAAVSRGASRAVLSELSGQFYTVIPHNFGFKAMSNFVLTTDKEVKEKLEMVQSLGEVEIASKILSTGVAMDEHPADAHYKRLKCVMEPLDHSHPTVAMIKDYVRTTHGATHSSYNLEVRQVFDLLRDGEAERFTRIGEPIGNRVLLWHGSRLSNYVGILSQGLRIAPPEAPVTGYMFGKGVYFADAVSKSANYCFTSRDKSTGLMILCEVALGKERPLLQADYYADRLPEGHFSTKGCGRYAPDPSTSVETPDGIRVPIGPMVTQPGADKMALLYNEFIVYKIEQIRMRYLIEMKFNYK